MGYYLKEQIVIRLVISLMLIFIVGGVLIDLLIWYDFFFCTIPKYERMQQKQKEWNKKYAGTRLELPF